MATRRRNDVDATSLRRIDVVTTLCACWEFAPPPWPPPPKILNLGPPNILNLPTPMSMKCSPNYSRELELLGEKNVFFFFLHFLHWQGLLQNPPQPGRPFCQNDNTVIFLNIGTDRSEQTVQTQIRLLLMEHSDQGLLCLLFCLHLLNTILHCKIQLFQL